MKKILTLSLVLFLLQTGSINYFAQDIGFGAGLMLGEPTGLSGKYWLDKTNAIDFGLGIAIFEDAVRMTFHADYLYHNWNLVETNFVMPIYYGFGARFRFREGRNGSFGIRGVLGATLFLKEEPVDIFFEIAPAFRLFPNTALDFDFALGGRYYFEIH
ncbi:MAG: hypothetical protein K8F36_04880 [Melioribacteraceae bacterium]|nr:hypothetical protein [Melioribacteraceae bacterium]